MEQWGKWVKMCCFWKTEWTNSAKPPPRRWKLVVSSADGTQGAGILGDGRRNTGQKWGGMGENGEEWGRSWGYMGGGAT